MQTHRHPDLLLRAAAFATWALVSGLVAWAALRHGVGPRWLLIVAAILINGAAMQVAMRAHGGEDLLCRIALWLQLGAAFAIGWLEPLGSTPIYTIIWVAIAAGHYEFRRALLFAAFVMVGWYLVMRFGWGANDALISVALYATFHLFALLSARNANDAQRAREQAEALNRELVATQYLLSEASRQGERTRIARNLHDLLGHHLTALTINLQIAERLSDGEVQERIAESRALARLLLSDVREAVDNLRSEKTLDFPEALRLLVEKTPNLDVSLDVQEGFAVDEIDIAESLLRCVQEGLTNTLRHAGATRSWIRVWRDGNEIRLEMHDDGKAAANLHEGNGLTGMRERLRALHGSLEVDRFGAALRLRVAIPAAA